MAAGVTFAFTAQRPRLFVGKSFASYDAVTDFINEYESQNRQKYWKRSSRKITSTVNIKRVIRPELVYYEISYSCIHGGEKFKSRGKGMRKAATFRLEDPCPAYIRLRASPNGEALEVKAFSEEHNHNALQEKWTVTQIEALIEEYKKYPILYDSNHEDYSNIERKNVCLLELVEALQNSRLGVTVEDVVAQWNALVVRYIHVLKKFSKSAGILRNDTRWYLQKLDFLKNHLNISDELESIEFDEDEDGEDSCSKRDPLETSTPIFVKEENEEISPPKKARNDDSSPEVETRFLKDETDIFGEFVTSQLKKISNDRVRQDTIFEIHQVIHRALRRS